MKTTISVIFVLIAFVISVPAPAAVQYTVLDLGTLGATGSYATALNNSGQVVGNSYVAEGGKHAFRTAPNQPINPLTDDLGLLPGGGESFARSINSTGQVAGHAFIDNSNQHAFRTAANQPIHSDSDDLGTFPGGSYSYANGINDSGQIAGDAHVNNGAHYAFRAPADRPINFETDCLGTLGGGYSFASAINNNGQVVGYSYKVNGEKRAFRTKPNQAIDPTTDDLGSLRGTYVGDGSSASAINDLGQVVGNAYISFSVCHAFRTSPNQAINPATDDLGSLGSRSSYANGINNNGQVVGFSYVGNSTTHHAFLYSGIGPMQDLNNLIVPIPGWTLVDATAINDKGQIVCNALSGEIPGYHAFLLTPIPEPSTLALLGMGGIGLIAYAWRRKQKICLTALILATLTAGAGIVQADAFGTGVNQFNIDFVPISTKPGGGYEVVNYNYRIGTYEITNDQWNKFTSSLGVPVTGIGGYDFSFQDYGTGTTNVPANDVSWHEAAQFVNWLNTSTGHQAAYKFIGTQGTRDYSFAVWDSTDIGYDASNPYRNKNACYFLPTEKEWMKAAYWNGQTLQDYATKPGEILTQGNGVSGKGWNYRTTQFATTPYGSWNVGSGSQELNGTYDMMGNNIEWMESPYNDPTFNANSPRSLRGGNWFYGSDLFNVTYRSNNAYPSHESTTLGFRVASVPEPSTLALLGMGGIGLIAYAWRRVKATRILVCFIALLASTAGMARADTFGTGANQFTLDFVPISGATNPTSGRGIVNHDYRTGICAISNDQWNKFTASLGVPVMGSPSSAYDASFYDWGTGTTDVPTECVSWYEAAQFVNWLNTNTGHQPAYRFTGTQGTSDYTFATWNAAEAAGGTNLYRNKNAYYFLPTEDEWVKAAYWNGTSLQQYATKPGDTLFQGDGTNGGWNYYITLNATNPSGPWAVTNGSQELNGTYNMMGNVQQWMESPYSDATYGAISSRGLRGGMFFYDANTLASSTRSIGNPTWEGNSIGFRVASIPEPTSLAMLLSIAVGGLIFWRQKA